VTRKYTLEDFRLAVSTSSSIRESLKKLNVVPAGGNYKTFEKFAEIHNVNLAHFNGKGWSKGKKRPAKRNLSEYFTNKFPIQSFKLKKRILSDGLMPYQCSSCGGKEWLGFKMPLELDHIDGNHKNNEFNNLRLLCPNCHALTSTYRGKNKCPRPDLNRDSLSEKRF
jgi:5-methylcytosine-specific restriction endonuclease McrA